MSDLGTAGKPPPAPEAAPGVESALPGVAGRSRDQQLEYKAILANASIGIAFTRDRKFTICNPRFAEMFGWKADELVGQPGDVVYPTRESYEAMGAIAIPVLGAGRQLDVEWEVRRKDGSTFLCRMIAKAVSPTDTQRGTVWIVEDITGRKRHADDVARLLREQDAILDTAWIGICFVRERKIVRCNRRLEEMYGYGPGELTGKPTSVTYAADADYARAEMGYTEMARGQAYSHVMQARRRDGSLFWERSTGRAVDPSDPARGSVWLMEDISEQKRAEEELQRVLAEQQAITNNVVIGIAFLRERRIVRCNRRFEELFGFGPGEANGSSSRQYYFTDEEFERVGRYIAQLDAGQTPNFEQYMRRKDGSGFWCRRTGKALAPGDLSKGYIWLFEDITEQKRIDGQIQRMVREQELILDNATVGIAFVRDRQFQRCNRFMEEMVGVAPGALMGQSTAVVFEREEDWKDAGRLAYGGTAPGETYELERRFRRADGSTFLARTRGRRIDSGGEEQEWIWSCEDVTIEREAEARVQLALAEQELILDNATVGICFVKDHLIQRGNRRMAEMLGYAASELANQPVSLLHPEPAVAEQRGTRIYAETPPGGTYVTETSIRRKDGSSFMGRIVGRRVDSGEAGQSWIWILEDVTDERAAREALERALAEQELILANATVGIVFARQRRFQRCNPRMEEMFGFGPGELVGHSTEALFESREEYQAAGERMYAQLGAGGTYQVERQFRRRDGTPFWCRVVMRAIDAARPEEGVIAIYDDISDERAVRQSLEASRDALERAVAERTEELQAANRRLQAEIADRRQAETRAQHLADHDALTGLPNRRLLEDRLTQALALSQRKRQQTAVMFVDLDRFKAINDSLGHAAGDVVLKEVAERLVKQLREGDTICRMGGDEFVVVLPEVKRSSDAANVAGKILETVGLPFKVEDRELHLTPSIGISVFPDDGRDAETLIRNADAAMYHAKETGRANYQFFTEQMNLAASRRLTLETDLRRALQAGEMRVYYQPLIDPASGKPRAHEALLRWQHPTRGLIGPSEFLQLAEDSGLILRLGEWVMAEACRWATFIGAERGLPVGVNLSSRQFNDPKLVDHVKRVLADSGLPPAQLVLEIPEAVLMHNTDQSMAILKKLRDAGVAIAVDSFGAAHSSLVGLRQMPVTYLKVDRSLVAEVHRDGRAIVAGILGLAHALGLKVAAVGVETEAQAEALKGCGCDVLQGNFLGAAVDADTAAKDYV
jgi:diguanylate cyclase (GGDEF)-like protein/PAS domain S-box-containing protein